MGNLVVCRNAGALLANIVVYGNGWVLFGSGQRTLDAEHDEWKFTASIYAHLCCCLLRSM